MDAVVNEYISKATNDSLGLFMEIKKIAAHYIENRRKLNKEKGICNRKQVHPIEIIEEIWPGAIEEIYELSLKSEWLMTWLVNGESENISAEGSGVLWKSWMG